MERQKLLEEIRKELGIVPGWMSSAPGELLEKQWAGMQWMQSITALTAREKTLVAYGAASAIGCPY